jgi:glycosyltransferase involved in cell wall biosynthesis
VHICVLSDKFPPRNTSGGADRVAFELARQYVQENHKVTVISTCKDNNNSGKLEHQGITIHYIHMEYKHNMIKRKFLGYVGIFNPITVPRVKELLEIISPDIVHSHNIHGFLSYYCLKLAKDKDIPVVLTFHDAMSFAYGQVDHFIDETDTSDATDIPKNYYSMSFTQLLKHASISYTPFRNIFNRKLINNYVDAHVSVSDELRKALEANNITCTKTIHNGVDTTPFTDAHGGAFRERYRLKKSKLILFAGRICRGKGIKKLGRAFRNIADSHSNIKLVIAGEKNDYMNRVKNVVKPYDDQIVETGWLDQQRLYNAYDAADVVVSPSIILDSFPVTNIEAMASATPVVTTCFGGTKEVVIDGETGHIVNPFDIEALTNSIVDILNHPKKAQYYGNQGFSRVSKRFNLENQAKEYLNLLENTIINNK